MPPFDSPYGRIAVVADPGGAAFGVITLAQPACSLPSLRA